MKILQLNVENVKRLKAVEIIPSENVVVVGGKNGAGKSSVLDSIEWALVGRRALPEKPVRTGEHKAEIVIKLDGEHGLIVRRTIKEDGRSQLTVTTADGMRPTSPQALLDRLYGAIAFDPLEFTRKKPADQAATLRELVGLDFSELDAMRQKLFEERTAVNRDLKAVKARLDVAAHYPEAPAEEVSVSALVDELDKAQAMNRAKQSAGIKAREKETEVADLAREAKSIVDRVEEAKRALAAALAALEEIHARRKAVEAEAKAAKAEADSMPESDCQPLHDRIADSERVNAAVRANRDRARLDDEYLNLAADAEDLTRKIAAIDGEKQEQLAAAHWPIDGLGFGDHGITFNGLPFEQGSSKEQLCVSAAIGLALKPELRVLLIRDGSLLDSDSLARFAVFAAENDAQVWIERVGEDGPVSVIIEDGAVKAEVTQ